MNKNKARLLGLIVCLAAPGAILADPPGPISDVPITVSSVAGEELADLGIVDVADFLGALPALRNLAGPETTDAAGTQPTLRGLDPNRTLVLVDGRRFVRTPAAPAATGVDITDFAESIERIEVIKDGAAAVYGANATGGAVNIVTSDRYGGINTSGSWTLPTTLDIFSRYSWSVQSKEQCDATHGEALPLWPYQDKHNYGFPEFADRGHKLYFGSIENGFRAPGKVDFRFPSMTTDPDSNLRDDAGHTYYLLDNLIARVHNDPEISDAAKKQFGMAIIWGMMFGGPGTFSDAEYAFGDFDPEYWYQQLLQINADLAAGGSISDAPGPTTPPPSITATAPSGEAKVPPFDRFAYPPDYAFDFSQCTDAQRADILNKINERDAARATMAYYMDYLRRDGQTTAEIEADEQRVQNARELRDELNDELRDLWVACQGTGGAGAAQPAATQPAGDASAATASDTQAADAGTGPASDAARQAAADRPGSCAFDESNRFNWNLEFHVNERYRLDSGSFGSRPAQGLGIDVFRRGGGFNYDLPFTKPRIGLEYDYFNDQPKRTFTDSNGRACVPLDEVSPQFYLTPDMLEFLQNNGIEGGTTTQQAPAVRTRKPMSGGSPFSMGAGYEYRFNDRTPEGRDWQFAVDVGMRGNYRPTLGVKLNWDKVDSVIQEYPGLGRPGMNFWNLPAETRDAIPDDFRFRAGAGFSIGRSFYLPFTYAEKENFDLGFLNNVPGQSGWSNNDCGDAALPPEGAGYLTKDMSPVKSLGDRWALARANVPDNDSLYIQYADPVIVGIIDTGLDWHHPDIAWENLWRNDDEIPDNGIDDDDNGYIDDVIGWNFMGDNNKPWDNDGHGTFVAGLIAATRGNDIGIDGINPNARIMVLKALNTFGRTRASYVAQAIVYGADNGARILNLSVTGPGFPKVVQDAVDYAESKGVLVVVAAGNRAEDIDRVRPSILQGVVTVAATGPDDKRTVFSNVGTAIDIAAPGQDVVSLRARQTDFMYNSVETTYVPGDAYLGDDNAYYRATGTSFAAPIVSGAASLVLSSQPNLNHIQVRRMLEQSARDVETRGRDRFTGYGLVDAEAALASNPEFYIHAEIPAVRRLDAGGQTFLQVIGIADADLFANASLEIGQGDDPQSWTKTGTELTEPVQLGELARIPAEQFAGAQTWTIRVVVEHQNGPNREARYIIELE